MSTYEKTIHWPLSLRFWETGRVYAKGTIEDGLRQGLWTFWYRSGVKQMEGLYKDGVQQGEWTKWWTNGTMATQGSFEGGWMHGKWIDCFDSGEIAQESHWEKGRRTGTTTVWDKRSGEVVRTEEFDVTREQPMDYPLMSNRDASFALASAQKMGIKLAWAGLIGPQISKYLDPWHIALWMMLFIPGYSLLEPRFAWGAMPMAMAGAAVLTLIIMVASLFHDNMTRPDIGINREKPKE